MKVLGDLESSVNVGLWEVFEIWVKHGKGDRYWCGNLDIETDKHGTLGMLGVGNCLACNDTWINPQLVVNTDRKTDRKQWIACSSQGRLK